jgi:hypothetical protein
MTEPTTRSPRDQFEEKENKNKKLGRRGKGGGMIPKENNLMPIYIITSDGKEMKVTGDKFFEMKAKGGRVGFKSGMKVCKLAKKGKGKAYGKNS